MQIAATETNLELTNKVPGDNDSYHYETWYMVSGVPVQKTGAMVQSQVYTISNFAVDTSAQGYDADAAAAAAAAQTQFTLNISAAGNVILLSGAIDSNTATDLDVNGASFKIKLTNNQGTIGVALVAGQTTNCAISNDTITGNYRVKTNNASGAEVESDPEQGTSLHAADAISVANA